MYRTLSLLTPSGRLTLGNLSARSSRCVRRSGTDAFFGVSDLHAMTIPHDARLLRDRTRELATLLLAVGLDRLDALRPEPGPDAHVAGLPARVRGHHRRARDA